jgi:hypothetical protein
MSALDHCGSVAARETFADNSSELKDTHLAPLTSGFSRSTSTSTIKADEPVPPQETPALAPTQSNASVASSNGIGTPFTSMSTSDEGSTLLTTVSL